MPMSYKFGILDTETTGLLSKDVKHIYPVQIAILTVKTSFDTTQGHIIDTYDTLVKMDTWDSAPKALEIHGITKEKANKDGIPIKDALFNTFNILKNVDAIVGHNLKYDMDDVILPNLRMFGMEDEYAILSAKPRICTCDIGARILYQKYGLKEYTGKDGNKRLDYIKPTLLTLYRELNGEDFDKPLHDAMNDCLATYSCIEIISKKYVRYLRTYDDCKKLFRPMY
jgi:DNA polymerase III epsilon subunit-like protein